MTPSRIRKQYIIATAVIAGIKDRPRRPPDWRLALMGKPRGEFRRRS
jgi:hypothetical protein